MVERAIPDAWSFSSPEAVLQARLQVVDTAWHRLQGDDSLVRDTADKILSLMEPVGVEGRVLYAGHRSLTVPDEAHLRLWHAATLYREYRGDGHVVSLATHGLSGLEAHLLAVATGAASRVSVQPNRGYTDDEWENGIASMAERGLVAADGGATREGVALRERIEDMTDQLAAAPWAGLSAAERDSLSGLLRPLAETVLAGDGIPFPNAMAFTRD
jgi:hypothetical protein